MRALGFGCRSAEGQDIVLLGLASHPTKIYGIGTDSARDSILDLEPDDALLDRAAFSGRGLPLEVLSARNVPLL